MASSAGWILSCKSAKYSSMGNTEDSGRKPAISPEHMASTAIQRSQLYSFLAEIFRKEPPAELLRKIRSAEIMAVLAENGVHLDTGFLETPLEQLTEDLAVEYTWLFLGPGGHIAPFESVQLKGGSGILQGPETEAVRSYIEAAGFDYSGNFHEMPDHVSVELEFLGHLSHLEAEAWQRDNVAEARNCREFQLDFLKQHAGRWIGDFCSRVKSTANSVFYTEMAELTAAFLESEGTEISAS